ncbi:MAG: type II toxin-antitoxin system RelE/ParE family toxin [Nanoarchaeota archaeon]|nr:type II toxin-antitoxin system RelE/ParE family toxin [Nanoarchaeota archaeon]
MYEIILSKGAERFLGKLDRANRERVIRALERIRIRPEKYLEKLVGEEGYKFRVGDYRLFIDIHKNDLLILVIKIGHRKNIYKK